jgi:Leucine-rich repeat (LRR) protein
MYGLLFCCSVLLTEANISMNCSIPMSEYSVLEYLFVGTDGSQWAWRSNQTEFGVPWNFSDNTSVQRLYRPCSDRWQGVTCDADASNPSTCSVSEIDLDSYSLKGSLPSEMVMLPSLEVLDLGNNLLSGTIPTILGLLSSLLQLNFACNYFTSSIPVGFTQLVQLTNFSIAGNKISGSIPTEIGLLTALSVMDLECNSLTGTIPAEIGELGQLTDFSVAANEIWGSIPTEIGLLTALSVMDLWYNSLTGTIPVEIGELGLLTFFSVAANGIRGSIPTEIGLLTALSVMYLEHNSLTGTIPVEVGELGQLTEFCVGGNSLTGSIPVAIGELGRLTKLYIYDNRLHGSVPSEIGKMASLRLVGMGGNTLGKTIPLEIGNLSQLTRLNLSYNLLTGSVPADLFRLQTLILGSNRLRGTISAGMFNVSYSLDLSSNNFYGSLPVVSRQSDMVVLFIGNNALWGKLSIFKTATFPNLVTLSVADNGFSGQLPEEIFELPALNILDASGNCFKGPLTFPDIMQASYLFLNELSSGKSCRYIIAPPFHFLGINGPGYQPHWYIDGSIPPVIWLQSNLRTLALEGNGLKGPLMPENASVPPNLFNLSVGFNRLTGTIPLEIQNHGFYFVGLSHNKFTGVVSSAFFANTKHIHVAVNRLSGYLNMKSSVLNKNILDGNLFSFHEDTTSLMYSKYTRYNGSVNLNFALVVSLFMFAWSCFIIVETIIPFSGLTSYHEWSAAECESQEYFYRLFVYITFHGALVTASMLIAFCCFKLSTTYSTRIHQHFWTPSVVFLHDVPPVATTCALLISVNVLGGMKIQREALDKTGNLEAFGTGWLSSLRSKVRQAWNRLCASTQVGSTAEESQKSVLRSGSEDLTACMFSVDNIFVWIVSCLSSGAEAMWTSPHEVSWSTYVTYVQLFLWIVGDICVWVIINAAYLAFIARTNPFLFLVQWGISIVACLWNIHFPCWVFYSLGWKDIRECIIFRYTLSILNVIVLPMVMSTLVSGLCFSQVFDQVEVDFPKICAGSVLNCEEVAPLEIAKTPPFTYSYECSSALIMTYVPIYFYQAFLSGFMSFVKLMVIPLFLQSLRSEHKNEFQKAIHSLIPTVLYSDALEKLTDTEIANFKIQESDWARAFFPVEGLTVELVVTTALFLTFGLAYPLLGLIIVISVLSDLCSWTIIVGRFRASLLDKDSSSHLRLNLLDSILRHHLTEFRFGVVESAVVVGICFVFWSMVWYDMISDIFGWRTGLISVTVIGAVCPFIVILLITFANKCDCIHPCDAIFTRFFKTAVRVNSISSRQSNDLFNPLIKDSSCEMSHSMQTSKSSLTPHFESENASEGDSGETGAAGTLMQVAQFGPEV